MPRPSLLSPTRSPRESRAAFVERRKAANAYIKTTAKGRLIWDSKDGTYRRPKSLDNA